MAGRTGKTFSITHCSRWGSSDQQPASSIKCYTSAAPSTINSVVVRPRETTRARSTKTNGRFELYLGQRQCYEQTVQRGMGRRRRRGRNKWSQLIILCIHVYGEMWPRDKEKELVAYKFAIEFLSRCTDRFTIRLKWSFGRGPLSSTAYCRGDNKLIAPKPITSNRVGGPVIKSKSTTVRPSKGLTVTLFPG